MYLAVKAALRRNYPGPLLLRSSSRTRKLGADCRFVSSSSSCFRPHFFPAYIVISLLAATINLKRAISSGILPTGDSTRESAEFTGQGAGKCGMAKHEGSSEASLLAMKFEVFGKVQGVFFRAHTRETAMSLGLVGYCRNTPQGTVEGEVQGPAKDVKIMLTWLSTTGSPQSVITKCEVIRMHPIDALSYNSFSVRH